MAQKLGPWSGTYEPDYSISIYKNGDPSRPITGVNLRSATRISTTKTLDDFSGTFDITLKDRSAQHLVHAMDTVTIRLRGHNQGWGIVFRGVVDDVEPDGDAEVASSQANITISGRCMGKYLQVNSLFLPVWDPQSNLPTALTFGLGDPQAKAKPDPRSIFAFILAHYVIAQRNMVGLSGTPNARFWLNLKNRFERVRNDDGSLFQVPFIQFDEDTTDQVLSRLSVQGFTEGWVDEVGNVVYRRPGWDRPASWTLHTGGLSNWSLPVSDVGLSTYVEVFPAGLPGLPSGQAQAMMSGRAPVPSDYVTGLKQSGAPGKVLVDPEFVIETDSTGKVTANGAKNWYYQQQKRYGLRPYQISSPLLASREQAQAQAEGLLRFMLRMVKAGNFTIPGEPNVRLGETIYVHGPLDDQMLGRTYYVQGVTQEYIEGQHYITTLQLSHGRDPGDPKWEQIALPALTAAQLAQEGGILSHSGAQGASLTSPLPSFTGTPNSRGVINPIPGFKRGRDDQGVDASATPGAPIYAPADCTIQFYDPNFYNGQPAVLYRFDQPLPGAPSQYFYVGEQINPVATSQGASFKQGQVIATYAQSGTAIEIGWGTWPPVGGSYTLAAARGDVAADRANSPPNSTPEGSSFRSYFGIP